ncbi:DUF4136 domain-containing protein [Aporhodopirellula aestuarii]|uniref:DUF4136 domain-containing protein n=1 Tax=Aporhodopirellula aestuarii TaxID=2950107 RepID=A0ABT0TXX0_9BACT|nr:DUF4136 domain-containing protein [Aporhodopirellula aestuarii]MCM2369442.1 DUF4136 domain-containing protein [Aporhodopirellula aestuarii]
MIANTPVEAITQFGVMLAFGIIVIVMFAVFASGTSIGRFLLPRAVTDVVSKLLPQSFITDAEATATGDFILQVSGTQRLTSVHVHRGVEMTIAWAYDESIEFPQTGTYAFSSFQHNLKANSALKPQKVKARIEKALADTLTSKQFQTSETGAADIGISVFGALEKEVSLQAITETFDRPDDDEWREAIHTAMTHGRDEEVTTLGRGSLVLDIVDSRTKEVLWRAAAISNMLVDVSDTEKERRMGVAVSEMLRRFPPSRV